MCVLDARAAAQSFEQLARAEGGEHGDALCAQLFDAALLAVEQHDGAGHLEARVAQSLHDAPARQVEFGARGGERLKEEEVFTKRALTCTVSMIEEPVVTTSSTIRHDCPHFQSPSTF